MKIGIMRRIRISVGIRIRGRRRKRMRIKIRIRIRRRIRIRDKDMDRDRDRDRDREITDTKSFIPFPLSLSSNLDNSTARSNSTRQLNRQLFRCSRRDDDNDNGMDTRRPLHAFYRLCNSSGDRSARRAKTRHLQRTPHREHIAALVCHSNRMLKSARRFIYFRE